MNGKSRQQTALAAGIVFSILWPSASTATKIALTDSQPFTICLVRFICAGIIMIIISHLILRQKLPQGRVWRALAIYGLLSNTLYLSLYVVAMQHVSAGLGSLSVATAPIFINLITAMLDRRRPGMVTLLSLVICLAGVTLAAWPLLRNSTATPGGLSLLLLGMISYSLSVIYFARTNWNGLPLLSINGWQILFGALFLVPFLALTWRADANHWTPDTWAAVLWLAIVVSIVAVRLWLWLLKVDAARSSFWLFLSPVFGFVISAIFTHEPVTAYTFAGMALVIAGIVWENRTTKVGMAAVLLMVFFPGETRAQHDTTVDVCIYGGTSAGVIAGYSAKRLGHSVLLIEPGGQVGGMTTGGLGETDIGNKSAITGLARDFYRRVGEKYGLPESWTFEPHVATAVFEEYIRSAGLPVWYRYRVSRVEKKGAIITTLVLEASSPAAKPKALTIHARIFIDCSYEGDLMAAAKVSFVTGRESNAEFNETFDGWQLRDKHQFPDGIDPYKKPGDPSSGLLWGVSRSAPGIAGARDNRIQAYNFRLCLTDDPANRLPIIKPERYQPDHYELLLRLIRARPGAPLSAYLNINDMPHHKTDINNNGPFSTDMIGMNYEYPDATYAERDRLRQAHADYTKGLLYFLGHDPRVPDTLRKEMQKWGYPKDEYTKSGHWTPQLYIREARRMRGEYVMTQANCQGRATIADSIGQAAYTMDSHNCERLVVNGMVRNEGDVQIGGFGPYPISYRSIVPKATECTNLLVPVCLSATHIAYGSIRMEPVFMVLGESAAVAAHLALLGNVTVQQVNVTKLQSILTTDPLLNSPASKAGQ